MRESVQSKRMRLGRVYSTLAQRYPDASLKLRFANPLELLIASILAAQCTDDRVNEATSSLFAKFRSAGDYANAEIAVLQQAISTLPMFRRKASMIMRACAALLEKHGGHVPADMSALVSLPGVGRKTANLVLGNVFGIPGIVVDTHVLRISGRLGLSEHTDRDKIEEDLMRLLDKDKWTHLAHLFGAFGRQICKAPRPLCPECPVGQLCPSFGKVGGSQGKTASARGAVKRRGASAS